MTCADGNLGPGLEQAQKNGSVKSLMGSLLITRSLMTIQI